MSILVPIVFIVLIIAFIAFILRRDSAVDDGKEPLSVAVGRYTITPSRWFWRKVRENKAAVAGLVIVTTSTVWMIAK